MTAAVKMRLTQLLPAVPYSLQSQLYQLRWWDVSAAEPGVFLCAVCMLSPGLRGFILQLPPTAQEHECEVNLKPRNCPYSVYLSGNGCLSLLVMNWPLVWSVRIAQNLIIAKKKLEI